jgi:hypothetical protein
VGGVRADPEQAPGEQAVDVGGAPVLQLRAGTPLGVSEEAGEPRAGEAGHVDDQLAAVRQPGHAP